MGECPITLKQKGQSPFSFFGRKFRLQPMVGGLPTLLRHKPNSVACSIGSNETLRLSNSDPKPLRRNPLAQLLANQLSNQNQPLPFADTQPQFHLSQNRSTPIQRGIFLFCANSPHLGLTCRLRTAKLNVSQLSEAIP